MNKDTWYIPYITKRGYLIKCNNGKPIFKRDVDTTTGRFCTKDKDDLLERLQKLCDDNKGINIDDFIIKELDYMPVLKGSSIAYLTNKNYGTCVFDADTMNMTYCNTCGIEIVHGEKYTHLGSRHICANCIKDLYDGCDWDNAKIYETGWVMSKMVLDDKLNGRR